MSLGTAPVWHESGLCPAPAFCPSTPPPSSSPPFLFPSLPLPLPSLLFSPLSFSSLGFERFASGGARPALFAGLPVCRFAALFGFLAAASCALFSAPFLPCRPGRFVPAAQRGSSPALLGSSPILRSICKRRDGRLSVRSGGGMRALSARSSRFLAVYPALFWRRARDLGINSAVKRGCGCNVPPKMLSFAAA